jgi:hypothetical protein
MSRPFRIRKYSIRFAGCGGSVAQHTELARAISQAQEINRDGWYIDFGFPEGDYFQSINGEAFLRDALKRRRISRVFLLHEFGDPEYELN